MAKKTKSNGEFAASAPAVHTKDTKNKHRFDLPVTNGKGTNGEVIPAQLSGVLYLDKALFDGVEIPENVEITVKAA